MANSKSSLTTVNEIDLVRKPTIWETLSSEKYFKWMLALPLIIVLLVFMVYPLIFCLYKSFFQSGLSGAATFIGLENYRTMLRDTNFWIPL